tara:strand:+ start:85 stop:927 length:843 start_codon:yes stop_codon:yes gene_type:complete
MKNLSKFSFSAAFTAGLILGGPSVALSQSTTAAVPALTPGMVAPTLDVGTSAVEKGTVQYSNSVGTNDAFSVGASTIVGASVNASSTPDYNVTSNAKFGVAASTINQVIGTSSVTSVPTTNLISNVDEVASGLTETEVQKDFTQDTTSGGYWWWNRRNRTRTKISSSEYESVKAEYSKQLKSDITETLTSSSSNSGTISGSFSKEFDTAGNTNNVTVNGIGTNANLTASDASSFVSTIEKGSGVNTGAGTASGGASGNVGTTATANANSSQFVSSFAQAY